MINYDIKDIYRWPFTAQALVLVFAAIVFIYLCYLFDLSGLQKEIISSKQEEQSLKKQYGDLLMKHALAVSNTGDTSSLIELLKTWQGKFIKPNEASDLDNQIIKIGEENGLHFDQFNPGLPVKSTEYIKIPAHIHTTGSMDQLGNFLSQLANYPKLIVINNFSITKEPVTSSDNNNATSSNLLTLELNLDIYEK